jgi:hypothetical protein
VRSSTASDELAALEAERGVVHVSELGERLREHGATLE